MSFGMSSLHSLGQPFLEYPLAARSLRPGTWATNFIAMTTKFHVEVVVECFPPFPMSHEYNTLESTCLSQQRRQRVSTMYHGSLISLYLCLQIVSGSFQVQSPRKTMVAMLGGEAELPCFLLPPQSVKNMKISWTRFLPSQVVHLYEDGRDKPEEAHEEYFGRTQLMTDSMHKGVVRLKISNIQPSDSGQYRCAFQQDSFYSDALITLKIAILGSRPRLHVEATKSRQRYVVCKSEGWFPQPKVQWMDSEGREISAESETHTQEKGGLFHVTSLLYREIEENLTCSVWNPILNQKKEGQLSPEVAEPNHTALIGTIIALAILTMLLIFLIPTGLYLYKKRKSLGVSCHSTWTQVETATTTSTYALVPERDPAEASADPLRVAPAEGISAVHPDQEAASANASETAQAEGIDATNPDQEAASTNVSGASQAEGIDATNPDQEAASTNVSGAAQAEGIDATNPDQEAASTNVSGTAQAEGIDAANPDQEEVSANASGTAQTKGISAAHPDQEAASTNVSGTAQAEGIDDTNSGQEAVSANSLGTSQAKDISAAHPDQDPVSAKAFGTAQAKGTDAANPDQDDTTANMSRDAPIPVKTPKASSTANVKHQRHSKYDTQEEAELRSWIEGLTGLSIGPDFQKGLKDGIILRKLMSKLQPGSFPNINQPTKNNTKETWQHRETLSNFNKAMVSFGIDSVFLFDPNDLCENKDMTKVQVSLLALKRKAKTNGL